MRRLTWTSLPAAVLLATATPVAGQGPSPVQNLTGASVPAAAVVDGAALYQRRCASCHDNLTERTPLRQAL